MNASTKARLAIVACSMIVVQTLIGCSTPTPTDPTATPRVLNAIVPNAMPGEDEIAVYPGATEVERDEENAPLGRSIFFVTPASLDEVYDFYKTTYTGKGWLVNEKRITFQDADFIWADEEGKVPWNVGLGLDVYNHAQGGTRYVVWVSREADPDNVPVIEGATDVKAFMSYDVMEELKELDLSPARVVTYATTLSVEEVLESYKYHMESYGWRSRDEQPGQVIFSYMYGVPERMYFNRALIKAAPGSDGKTQVIIGAAGADVHELNGPYTPPVAGIARLLPPPPEVPKCPGAKSTTVNDSRRWQSRLFGLKTMTAWTCQDSPEKVKAFYVQALTKQGWKQVEHARPDWYRFVYETGPTCQSRHAVYLVITKQPKDASHLLMITYIGCYVISGDE